MVAKTHRGICQHWNRNTSDGIERNLLENANDCPEGDQATASTQQLAASSQYTSPNSTGCGNGPEFTIESSTSASNVLKTLKDATE
jgi:hypothetical protein